MLTEARMITPGIGGWSGKKGFSEEMRMFYTLIWIVLTQMYTYIKIFELYTSDLYAFPTHIYFRHKDAKI